MSAKGTLKKFFQGKGFGFVEAEHGRDDRFAHVRDSPERENCQQCDQSPSTKYGMIAKANTKPKTCLVEAVAAVAAVVGRLQLCCNDLIIQPLWQ